MKESYLKLFTDSLEKYKRLTDEEFGQLIRAELEYKRSGTVPDFDNITLNILFDSVKLEIDRTNDNYDKVVAARAASGKKGAAKRWDGKNSNCHEKKEEEKEKDKEKDKEVTLNGSHTASGTPSLSETEGGILIL